jgi:surface protein
MDGDSALDVIDLSTVMLITSEHTTATGAEFLAADLNRDGKITRGSDDNPGDYEMVTDIVLGGKEGYTSYYNKLTGAPHCIMENANEITFSKWSNVKDATKIVFEKQFPDNLTISSSVSNVLPDSNIGYYISAIDNVAFYLTTDNDDKVLHIAGKDSIVLASPNMSKFFSAFTKVETIDFNNALDTRNVTDFSGMFEVCSSLKEIKGLSSLNTSKATTMASMFSGCEKLESINGLDKWDTSNVTKFTDMFICCCALESINVSNFNTSNATSLGGMFYCCEALDTINVSNFDTSKAEDLEYMFSYSYGLTELDISNFNTKNATMMDGMFEGCSGLEHIYVGENWDDHGVDPELMFYDCGVNAVEYK